MLNSLIRGGQIVLHSWQMLKQVLKALFFSSLFIIFIIVITRINFQLNKNDIKYTSTFYVAKFYTTTNRPNKLLKVNLYNNKNLSKQIYSAKQLVENSLLINSKNRSKIVFVSNFYFGIKLYIYSIIIVLISFLVKGYTTTKSNFIRGNRIVSQNY